MANSVIITDTNQIVVTKNPKSNVVTVNSPGPQGPAGVQGPAFSSGSTVITGSLTVSQSFVDFTNSTGVSGSFSGSFEGNGSGLTNIPASGITGLNLSQIASGSATASISPNLGFEVNTNITASGNISSSGYISASYFIGDGSQLTNLPLVTSSSYALTASYVETAQTSSYVLQAVSASYAVSASHEIIKEVSSSHADTASFAQSGDGLFSGSFSGSFEGDGSNLTGIVSSKWTGSNPISRASNVEITGSFIITGPSGYFQQSGGTTSINTINTAGVSATPKLLIYSPEGGTYGWTHTNETVEMSSYLDTKGWIGMDTAHDLTLYTPSSTATLHNSPAGKFSVTTLSATSHITSSGNISASGYVSASYFIGDGSQLTNLPLVTSSSYALTASYVETAQTASYVLQAVSASYAVSASHEIIKEVSSSHADTASFAQSGDGTFSGSFSGSFEGDGSQLTGIASSTNLTQSIFVSPSGDNGTAVVGDLHKPFQTILSATASANIGDTIMVYPGTYPSESSNIIKDGVNYYFYPGAVVHPTASLNEWIVNIIDPTYPVNVRGAGTFISDDTEYGAIKIQAKECYFEFDTAKTTNNTTSTFNEGGTVALEPTNTDGGYYEKGNPFYVKGKIINTGDFGNYAAALVFGRSGIGTYAGGTFEGSVMQLHPTDTRPAIWTGDNQYDHSVKINADVFASGSEAVLSEGRGDIVLRGKYTTGLKDTKYAVKIADGYHQWYDIDADINGSLNLNTGGVNNSGGIVRGRIRTGGTSPDACAIYINGGGQHKIDNQIYCRDNGAHGIKMDTDVSQVEFTGDFNADAGSSYINFCKVTTGKLIFKGSLGSTANRGNGNIIDGGHLVIDSFFDNDGSSYPANAYCFVLSAGTLEINSKVTHAYTTTGSGIVDMTGGYLKLNGAEIVQLNGTGSWAYAIDLNSGTHSGSILNNSFTNVTPFGPGSFTNEVVGGGTLFYSDKLY